MTKDEVWQKIKEDKTEIYGQTMLDAFLAATDLISEKHMLSLDQKQRDLLRPELICKSMFFALSPEGLAKFLGRKNMNKIDNAKIYKLVQQIGSNYKLENVVIFHRDLNDTTIADLMQFTANPSITIKKILSIKNKLNSNNVFYMLKHIMPDDFLNLAGEENLNSLNEADIEQLFGEMFGLKLRTFAKILDKNYHNKTPRIQVFIDKYKEASIQDLIWPNRGT